MKITDFCPSIWRIGVDYYADLDYQDTFFSTCLPIHYQTILSFHLMYNLKFNFFEVARYISLYSEITFSEIGNLFLERITFL